MSSDPLERILLYHDLQDAVHDVLNALVKQPDGSFVLPADRRYELDVLVDLSHYKRFI